MNDLAVVLLAHADGRQLQRLVSSLDGLPIFLHCDVKTEPGQYALMADLSERVTMLPRTDARLSSWSLVTAELLGLRAALSSTQAAHVAVMSGACYPLMTVPDLLESLRPWQGHSYFFNRPLPYSFWNTKRRHDGGEWRMRYPVLTRRGNVVMLHTLPVHWPFKRDIPEGLELRASSQWKIYSREHVELLLRVADSRPDLMRFWRSTFVPDESFAASILSSPALVGSAALRPCLANPWHYEWEPEGDHPRWLEDADFDLLEELRFSPDLGPEAAFLENESQEPKHRKLFARKFSSTRGSALLDRIDTELRQ
ncbi:MAG TPA: beta-1,6-N-acetylglucosaminyltransferase [Propionibacteriaceae bacterium]|nr:beta-1,6-N-acetylglucosaminyltransferase [Propionibacteriaceae bacterium]